MNTEWSTPHDLFLTLHEEFHFTVDVCAAAWNAKRPVYYTRADNGLLLPWSGVCWCNPPFDTQGQWVRKAWDACQDGATVVVLLPSSYVHDTDWFHTYAFRASEIRYIRGRPVFRDPQGGRTRLSAMVIVFTPDSLGPPRLSSIDPAGRPLSQLPLQTHLKQTTFLPDLPRELLTSLLRRSFKLLDRWRFDYFNEQSYKAVYVDTDTFLDSLPEGVFNGRL